MSLLRLVRSFSLPFFAFVVLSAVTFAQASPDRTQFGHNINIGPGEEIGEATCFGCSVRVRGHVKSDVTVFGGTVIIEDQGQVAGDATVFGGDVHMERDADIKGDLTVFGGKIRRDPGATVAGDVTNFGGGSWLWMFLIFVLPLVVVGGILTAIILLIRRLLRPDVPATA